MVLFVFITVGDPMPAVADMITFEWNKVTTDVSGQPLTGATKLTAYKLYVSSVSGGYGSPTIAFITPATTGTVETYKYTNNVRGTYFATVSAYNSAGESLKSNEVTFTITAKMPIAATDLIVKSVQ